MLNRKLLDPGDGKTCCCSESDLTCTQLLLSRPVRLCLLLAFMFTLTHLCYLFYLGSTWALALPTFGEQHTAGRAINDTARAKKVLSSLCDAYNRSEVSGDACQRLCTNREWTIVEYYEGNKVVVMLKEGEKQAVFKSLHPFIGDFEAPPAEEKEENFRRRILDETNYALMLGWPSELIDNLLSILWPDYLRTSSEQLSQADRRSLWALVKQHEFLTFRILPLSLVTPKVIGSCGHFYEVESLVGFKMKTYDTNLKGKVVNHLMGTIKLTFDFLNEPLQWCDVRFDNLALAAVYPKRFMLMDGDLFFTNSKLKSIMSAKSCKTDADCSIGDCKSRCQADFKCGPRTNENLDVFCDKLINKLFPTTAWTSYKHLRAYISSCHDTVTNTTQKLQDLRGTWAYTLPDDSFDPANAKD